MVEEDKAKGYYARAHAKILSLIPGLKGETLKREDWWKLCNVSATDFRHIPYREAINDVLFNLSQVNKKKVIAKNGSGFTVINDTLVPIDFKHPVGSRVDLLFPFDLHQYGFLFRKNLMIVYGSKDAGKTAFLLNTIRLNMNNHKIIYWSSEMAEEELNVRLGKYDGMSVEDWNFTAMERSYDFDQVIDPDCVNIIDYLELGGDESEYYMGVALVRKIYDKLDQGVAIIACQKNKEAELPKGGSGLLEKARMAVSLDPGKITLTICKNWADGVLTSPRGRSWSYQLVGGINIVNSEET